MKLAIPLIAFGISILGVRLALRSPGLLARFTAAQSGERWSDTPTPRIGGIGIFGGFAAALVLALASGALSSPREIAAVLAGSTILFVLGLIDDLRALPPLAKLVGQFAAAIIVLQSGISVEAVGNDRLAYVLGLLWLVGMTNALNLLDNMDGLAASLAIVSASFFAIAAATVNPNADVALVAASLAAAVVGFLPYNLRPGRSAAAYMGDSGSQLLGFTLASLGLMASYKVAGTTIATLVLPLLILAVPILDTGLVTLLRLLEGRSITQGGADHTSHRLVRRGLSETRTVLLLVGVSAGLGATSLAYLVLDSARITTVGVLITFALLLQFATVLSGRLEEADGPPGGEARERPDGSWGIRLRRLSEVAVDGALITASFYAAYLIEIEGAGTENQRHVFIVSLPLVLAARYLTFWGFGLYRSIWRFAGAHDAALVAAAVAVSTVAGYAAVVTLHDLHDFPASIFVVDSLICVVLVTAARFGERALIGLLESLRGRGRMHRTLIVGAGPAGRSLERELSETPGERVVGFVDDDPRLAGRRLHGVRVLGTLAELATALERSHPDAVLVTIGDPDDERLGRLATACAAAGVEVRFVRRELTPLSTAARVTAK